MPRLFELETISFTDRDGRTIGIKEIREIPVVIEAFKLDLNQGDELDEIASRDDIFGEGSEFEAYKIADANIAALVDADFDLNKLRKLIIPT